ncbi:MAG: GIDE domain-containing protein [Polyangiales bacterium]
MTAIGTILLFIGVLALIGGVIQKVRAGRLGNTPFAGTGQVATQGRSLADPKGSISTQGQVQTQQVLTSPVSGAPCVYYAMKLEVEWTDNNVQSKYTVTEDAQAVPFALNDGSGPAVVRIDPKRGGEFPVTKPFDRKKFSRGLMASIGQKPLEVTAQFTIPASVQVQGPLGRMIEVPVTATYFVSEQFLEPKGPLYVNGKLGDDGAITSPSWTSLILADKSRDDLLASTMGFSKKAFIAGGVMSPLGVIGLVVGHLTAPPPPPPAPATPAALAAPAVAPGAAVPGAPGAVAVPGAAGGTGAGANHTASLTMTGECAAFQLPGAVTRVMPADGAVNVVAIVGTTLNRVFVKLEGAAPGETVDVCKLGRRCRQNLQVGVGDAVFLNAGRAVSGTITVTEFAPADGRMNVTFHDVVLPRNQGEGSCTVNGSLATTGFTQ